MTPENCAYVISLYEKHKTDFLVLFFYIDDTGWEGDIRSGKYQHIDKEMYRVFTTLSARKQSEVFAYIENGEIR